MRLRVKIILPVLFIVLSIPAAAEVELHGKADTVFATGFWDTSDILAAHVKFKPRLEFFHGNFAAVASVNAGYSALDPKKIDFKLGELYAEYGWDMFDFRIGRQIIAWGKADGIQITDIICPKDYTEFIGSDYKDSRVPATGIQLRHFGSFYTIEGNWIPVYMPSIPEFNEKNPMNAVIFPSEFENSGMTVKADYTINKKSPSHSIKDGEWGLRASFFFPVMDFSFSAFRGWDHDANFEMSGDLTPWALPKPNPTHAALTLTPSYNRIWMAGFDMAIPIDMFIIRAEAAWLGKREFSKKLVVDMAGKMTIPLGKHHQLKALAGLECNPGSGWQINLQYMEDVVFENVDTLARHQRLPLATLFVSKTMLRDTLKLSGSFVLGCDAWDSATSVDLGYDITDGFCLTLGGSVYCQGKDEGIFGKMQELSNIRLKAEFSF